MEHLELHRVGAGVTGRRDIADGMGEAEIRIGIGVARPGLGDDEAAIAAIQVQHSGSRRCFAGG